MRLPFPVRIPFKAACLFAGVLMIVQLVEGTDPLFALCCLFFIVIATAAFNLAGGFSRPSGAYVFFYSTLTVIVGLCTKAFLGQAANSNLLVPQRTIAVFLGGIVTMYGAVYVSRKLRPAKGLLEGVIPENDLQNATVGCMVTGLLVNAILAFVPASAGSLVTGLSQINRFLPMAMILGTIYQIRKSGGTSSVNIPVLISGAGILSIGLWGFSKEGIFTPLLCWLIAAASQNYKLSRGQILGVTAISIFMIVYMVPYSQYGRDYHNEADPNTTQLQTTIFLLNNLGDVRRQYEADTKSTAGNVQGYYGQSLGLLDRLQMLSIDDELIDATERSGPLGMLPLYMNFANLVPHFIWADKPVPIGGNYYAHEIGGIITDDDDSTGISFSPTGEAYHLERWFGVFLVAPLLWTMLFTLFDALCGDTRLSHWGLLMVAYFSHMAPEGMLAGVIYTMGFGAFGLIVTALSAMYFMPILGILVKGPKRGVVHRGGPIRSISRRRSDILPSSSVGQ